MPQAIALIGLVVALGYIISGSHAATALPGDINNDGVVNVFDLSILLSHWSTTDATSDINSDGTVNVFDLSILLSHWGQTSGATPSPTASPTGYSCVTTYDSTSPTFDPNLTSECPPDNAGYTDHPTITGTGSIHRDGNDPVVNQDVWSSDLIISTLSANSASDWKVDSNITNSSSGGGVEMFPNVGWYPYPAETPNDSFNSITMSWDVTMPTDPTKAIGWATTDLWFNGDWANNPYELMIQPDVTQTSDYDCSLYQVATNITFSGHAWHLCQFGSGPGAESVWKPGVDEEHIVNLPSGSIDVKALVSWMEQHGYLPAQALWYGQSFGFEICNTFGTTQEFKVNNFSWVQN